MTWEPVQGDGSPSRQAWYLFRRASFTVQGWEYFMDGDKRRRFTSLNAAKKAAAKLNNAKNPPTPVKEQAG